MKNIFFFFIAVVILVFSACETDFDLEGDWKDIPVVYAYISEQDTAHYVRVEKAFLEPGGNANEIAQMVDSLYYKEDQLTVKLENESGEQYELVRVDGNEEGYVRDQGVFANQPNYLYKIDKNTINLTPGELFKLILEKTGSGDTIAIANSQMIYPMEFRSLPNTGFLRIGDFDKTSRVQWRPGEDVAKIFDVRIRFRYRESTADAPDNFVDKEVVWLLDDKYPRDEDVSSEALVYDNESFYAYLGQSIPTQAGVTREFDHIVYQVSGVGVEVEEYLRISQANTGITSSQALPVYSNVENGIGLVTSRYTIVSDELRLDARSMDTLITGVSTRDLNFQQ